MRWIVQMGERGRLVVPAAARRALGVGAGDQLVLELDGEEARLVPARTAVSRFRGMFRGRYGDRSLVDELIAERRSEAEREADTLAGR
jgi:AbrB family looped-hinge helix DNA binding protein